VTLSSSWIVAVAIAFLLLSLTPTSLAAGAGVASEEVFSTEGHRTATVRSAERSGPSIAILKSAWHFSSF